jgi:hypothetical protein
MRQALVTTSLLLALLSSSHVYADSADSADTPPPPEDVQWYGWQTLVADALSLSVLGLGLSTGSVELGLTGAASLIVTPPIIHAVHKNGVASAVSLTLRVGGVALLFASFSIALNNIDFDTDAENRGSNDDGEADTLGALGFGLLVAAPILDAIMATDRSGERAPARAWTVQPWLSPQARSGGLAFAARL